MEIDENTIKDVAKNARLNLTEEEIKEFTPQLKEVLNSFSKIDEVDVENTKPSFQPVEIKNKLREDEPKEPFSQDEALANSPYKKDGYFKGPKAV